MAVRNISLAAMQLCLNCESQSLEALLPHHSSRLLHKLKFSFLNAYLMVLTDRLPILQRAAALRTDEVPINAN